MTFAKRLKSSAAMTLLALATAGAAHGQSVETGGNVDAGVSVGTEGTAAAGIGAEARLGAEAETGTAAGAETGVVPEGPVIVSAEELEAAIAEGSALLFASDAAVIGTVAEVDPQADGSARLIVALDEALGLDVNAVQIDSRSTFLADGGLQLQVTKEQFVAAVESRLNAGAGATATN